MVVFHLAEACARTNTREKAMIKALMAAFDVEDNENKTNTLASCDLFGVC